ncbi:MAG: glucose-6-phosphate dehydrogenase assembly protein OpcA [Bryobacteraceae bacterium]|nr:glucose-6-phosphate dehydrogenase assembly protein OpcA [Bryobacteraceae bacterium]
MAATLQADKLLRDLANVWEEMGKQGVEDKSGGVLRACAMNLLVCVEGDVEVGETLADLVHEFPSRVIVLRVKKTSKPTLEGRAIAQCWMPFGRRQQICAEQIELMASPDTLRDTPSVIRGLWASELPIVMWFRHAGLLRYPEFATLLPMAHKVIVDSRDSEDPERTITELQALQQKGHAVGDLAWSRITRWRESVAQMFDHPSCAAKSGAINAITVTHTSLSTPTTSRYLAEWVASSLGRDVAIEYKSLSQPRAWEIHSLELRGDGFAATITRKDANQVEIRWDGYTSALMFPKLTPSTLLLEEFEVLDRDPIFERVLARL